MIRIGAIVILRVLYTSLSAKILGSGLFPPDISKMPRMKTTPPIAIHIKFSLPNKLLYFFSIPLECAANYRKYLNQQVVVQVKDQLIEVVELHFKIFGHAAVCADKSNADAN